MAHKDPMRVVIENLLTIQRAGNAISDDARERLYKLFGEIAALVGKIDPTGPSLQRWRVERLDKLTREVEALVGPAFDDVNRITSDALARLGKQQTDQAALHLRAIIGAGNAGAVEVVKVTLPQLRAIIREDPIEGALLKDWFRDRSQATVFRVRRELQLGLTNAETVGDMVRRVRGRFAGYQTINGERVPKYTGGVLGTTTREAEAIVRTAANHVSNSAALDVYRANADVVSKVEWTSALDGRVCAECGAMDGRSWALDDPGLRRPPRHPNDRCILVPRMDWKALGMEPPPEGTRASMDGQVPSDVRYEAWLKGQPMTVQAEVLGPTRAKLFSEGRISLRDLVRTDGSRVRLEDLAAVA